MEILSVDNLSFAYTGEARKALDGVSLGVQEGEFVVICGQSGCGKTTLLRLLKPQLAPKGRLTGTLRYDGADLGGLPESRTAGEIGFVLQNPETQVTTDKVWHELAFGLENLGLDQQTMRLRVGEMANYFGIHDWFHQRTDSLSGGQKQILNLASVIVMQPRILLLDEPTAQLDPITAADFILTLHKLNEELGLTIVLVEHRLEEAFPLADRVLVMEAGQVIADTAPETVGPALAALQPDHPMQSALPSAVRIYSGLGLTGRSPLTVKQGRGFLRNCYANTVRSLDPAPSPGGGEPCIRLDNVWFRYEKELPDVLSGLSLEIYRGEIFSILGANGSGKTTLLGVIAGQNRAYRGKVLLEGRKIRDLSPARLYRHNLALLPQNPQSVFVGSTLEEDYRQIAGVMGYDRGETDRRIGEIVETLGLTGKLSSHPYDLSGGEQQRAALGKMLLLDPKILLLDEPTKGIDAHAKLALRDILLSLKARGITVVMVTHDVEYAAVSADRCGLFFDGEIVSTGPPGPFFSGNSFYTTAANRISRHRYDGAISCQEVIRLCQLNGPCAPAAI